MPKKLAAGLTDNVCCFWVGNLLPIRCLFLTRAESSDLKEDGQEEGFTRAEPWEAPSPSMEPLRQGWLPIGGKMTQYSLLTD